MRTKIFNLYRISVGDDDYYVEALDVESAIDAWMRDVTYGQEPLPEPNEIVRLESKCDVIRQGGQ